LVKKSYLRFSELELRNYYNLCTFCTSRLTSLRIGDQLCIEYGSCFICRGLMNQLDYLDLLIESEVGNNYEFETFCIGISLPHDIFDREDQVRARHKLKGNESIKSQLQNQLRERFQQRSKKKLSFSEPDLSINVVISQAGKARIFAKSRSLTFTGRYIKKQRGLPQRQRLCRQCEREGKERESRIQCSHHGRSIEGIIAAELIRVTKCNFLKFSWVGSEDASSLVSGKGRPFFVRLSDPKLRSLNSHIFIETCEVEIILRAGPKSAPQSPIRFITRAKVLVESSEPFEVQRFEALSQLNSSLVKFQDKNRSTSKRIYSIECSSVTAKCFELKIMVEGGFTIKKFVSGSDNTVPNVSEIIGTKCETKVFDISEVVLK
jgi:tRNA pseudouridine synthase 10